MSNARRYAPALVVLAVIVGFHVLGPTRDPDVFWHLRTGEVALRLRSALPVDVFSFSREGAPWRYKDLVAGVILYLGFRSFGYAWFVALKAAAAAGMTAAYYFALPSERRHPLILVVAMGTVLDSFWLVERPYLFSFALFPAALALVERCRRRTKHDSNGGLACTFAPFVAVNVAWTFLHRFALLGHALLAGVAAFALAARLAGDRPFVRTLLGPRPSWRFCAGALVASGASVALGLLNPSGVAAYTTAVGSPASRSALRLVTEWKHLDARQMWEVFPVMMVAATLALAWATWRVVRALRRRQTSPPVCGWHLLLLGVFAALTADSVRWSMYLAMTAALVLSCALGEVLAASDVPTASARASSRRLPRGTLALTGLVFLGVLRWQQAGASLAIGEDPDWSPRDAVRFARDHGLSGRVANSYDFGGYVIWTSWPDTKVLVDGRLEQVYDPEHCARSVHAQVDRAEFERMRGEDGASWVLAVNRADQVDFGFLAGDPRWAMVFWSDTAAVYVEQAVHPALAPLAYRSIDPYNPAASVLAATAATQGDPKTLASILREIMRMIEVSPRASRPALALAFFWHAQGPLHLAERDRALAHLVEVAAEDRGTMELVRAMRSEMPSP